MEENGFIRSTTDPCIYIRQNQSERLLIAIYVDDGLIAGSTQEAVDLFLRLLASEFKITKGSLDSFLGIQIQQRESGLFLSQQVYVERILQRFNMATCNSTKTSVDNQQPDKTINVPLENFIPYRSAVDSLMYLACATRPDIAYAISKAARSMAKPTIFYWIFVKRIFRYLRGTTDFGLNYTLTGSGLLPTQMRISQLTPTLEDQQMVLFLLLVALRFLGLLNCKSQFQLFSCTFNNRGRVCCCQRRFKGTCMA